MNKIKILSLIVISSLFLANSPLVFSKPPVESLDKIVAIAEEEVITQSMLDAEIAQIHQNIAHNHRTVPAPKILRQQALETLIRLKLQLQLAKQNGIQVTDEELTQAIESIAKQNQRTLAELREQLQYEGFSYAKFREKIREGLLIHKIQQQAVANKIDVSNQEINDYIQTHRHQNQPRNSDKTGVLSEIHLRQIVLKTDPINSDEKVKARLLEMRRQILAGTDFAKLAEQYSKDGNSAVKGGDMGWMIEQQLPPDILTKIAAIKTNTIGEPFKTQYGWHLVQVMGRRNTDKSADIRRHEIRQIIFQRKLEAQLAVWLRQLQNQAHVEIFEAP